MVSLRATLGAGDKRSQVIEDACAVLEAEVDSKGGLSGMAIKTAYKVVKGVQPGFIRKAIDFLLDDFLEALDPMYQESLERSVDPGQHLQADPSRVADALLAITDARASRAKSDLLKKTYNRLRPSAKTHVEAAVPRLAGLMNKHAPAAAPAAG
jgi:hypothetical protein